MTPDDELARIQEERKANAARKAALGRGAEMTAVSTFEVPVARASGEESTVRCRYLVPNKTGDDTWPGVFVYFHGGAWIYGSIDTFDRLGRELARRSGWVVCMVDYAKAPEHVFPAAVADAGAAVRWVAQHAETDLRDLGVPLASGFSRSWAPASREHGREKPPARGWRLAVGGDSSGGNLAAVTARKAVETGVRLDGQVLIYPVTDCDLKRSSYAAKPGSVWHMQEVWRTYTGSYPGKGPTTLPDASPLRAESLAGQAPALVLNAEDDALNSEIDAYAERLAAEGVPVARHFIPDSPHGILSYWDTVPPASEAVDAIAAWLNGLSG